MDGNLRWMPLYLKQRKRSIIAFHEKHFSRAREGTCFFTVASTVCKISAAKPRNSAQRGANQLAYGQL
jgi:hypothetical protein